MARHFLSVDDLTPQELVDLLDQADDAKRDPAAWSNRLETKHVALLFEKPSTRTRVSFEVAIGSMGGRSVSLTGAELQLGRGETIEDTGRVLSRYVDAIVVRTFGQDRLERLADAATVPIINALSDFSHPCQCLSDLQTVREKKGRLAGITLSYLGDGNNVAHSLMFGCAKTGVDLRLSCPPGHEPFPQVYERSVEIAASSGGSVRLIEDPREATRDADVIYTDVWVSMGAAESAPRSLAAFGRHQVNAELVGVARDDAIVMHCLPAHRGEEITPDVMDGPRSVVWDQAENRLHSQKALLAQLLG